MTIAQRTRTYYRVKCGAHWDAPGGCWGSASEGGSPREARELALEDGWDNKNGIWICPSHLAVERDNLGKQGFIVEGD